jgi:hypothetical protein
MYSLGFGRTSSTANVTSESVHSSAAVGVGTDRGLDDATVGDTTGGATGDVGTVGGATGDVGTVGGETVTVGKVGTVGCHSWSCRETSEPCWVEQR